ncbi:MAG: ribosomal L7Ae/L30e/S12e/Gadd45 family protein [Clostridia bacterium]|nr:ribosomal L7Ae/L30e/S12e/Gadd45 family protein [Clostridia bacterium]
MINKIYSMLGLCMKAGKLAYGSDMCEENIKNKKAKILIIAVDTSDNTKKKFENICARENTELFFFGDIDSISHSIGKSNKAIIAILDDGFANKIKDMLKELKGANI